MMTKPAHASRHWSPATIAIGPAIATPHPVPELIVDHTRSRRDGSTCWSTMSAYGGKASPAAEPATSTPAASTATLSATAIVVMPIVASAAAPPTATFDPQRATTCTTSTLATR